MAAYYNEIDKNAAQHLRNLISAGVIAPGDVDERSVEDVRPDELMGYTQCHFFAGIGVWSYSLRCAGWSDDRPVWTGSCPCQPFSSAGKGTGFVDERHLWPAWHHLISQCCPDTVFGEQVASKDGLAWLDLVYSDMEATGYAFAPVDQCAAGVGAPHIRQRLYFVAHPDSHRCEPWGKIQSVRQEYDLEYGGTKIGLANTHGEFMHGKGKSGSRRRSESSDRLRYSGMAITDDSERGTDNTEWNDGVRHDTGRAQGAGNLERCDSSHRMGNADLIRQPGSGQLGRPSDNTPRTDRKVHRDEHAVTSMLMEPGDDVGVGLADANMQRSQGWIGGRDSARKCFVGKSGLECEGLPGPVNGHWKTADWLFCRDGKWRPVESCTFPLVDGSSFHMGSGSAFEGKTRSSLLKGYGNAIVAPVAEAFIRSYMEI